MSNETRKTEAKGGKTANVEFRGHTFEVSVEYDDWPVAFTEALEDGKSVGICKGALGPRQWRTVQAMNLRNRDLAELADKIAAAMGFGSTGESEASAG